mgnify:CR=1 FL=1
MCGQTVGLLAAAIERAGVTTTSISLLKEVTSVIRPPRALFVPFPMGYPLGAPNDTALQHRRTSAAPGKARPGAHGLLGLTADFGVTGRDIFLPLPGSDHSAS